MEYGLISGCLRAGGFCMAWSVLLISSPIFV